MSDYYDKKNEKRWHDLYQMFKLSPYVIIILTLLFILFKLL